MKLINDKITVDLSQYIDINSLLAIKPYVDYAIVKHSALQVPAQYAGDLFLDKGQGFMDISQQLKLELLEKYPFIGDLDYKHLLLWLRYNMDIKYGQSHLFVIKAQSWETKHLQNECVRMEPYETFKPLLDWIDAQNIFLEYGRVNIFLNEPYTQTPTHIDPTKSNRQDQFVWITLDNRKKFFIYDQDTKIKHYLTGYVGTFDNHNYHGSEATEYASYSIRVDGIFSDNFLEKTELYKHYKV